MGTQIKIGSGGYFPEYGKPLYSNNSTKATVEHQKDILQWYSKFDLDVYVLQDQLVAKSVSKNFDDVNDVKRHKSDFADLGHLINDLGMLTWVHSSHFVSVSTPHESVKKMTTTELLRFKNILRYTDNRIRYVTIHLGGRYKGVLSHDQAIKNAIALLREIGLGDSLCIENEDANGKLGSCDDVLNVCMELKARPLFDVAHFQRREKGDYFKMLCRFAELWPSNEHMIVHYSTNDMLGNHVEIDWSAFQQFCRKILDHQLRAAIDLETPQEVRLQSCLKAKQIIDTLEPIR
jgi:UV DNA damage repair endonuclease